MWTVSGKRPQRCGGGSSGTGGEANAGALGLGEAKARAQARGRWCRGDQGHKWAQTISQALLENANFILLAMGVQKFKIFKKATEKLRLAHLKVPSVWRQA